MSPKKLRIPVWETIEKILADLESKEDADKIEIEALTLRLILAGLLDLRRLCWTLLP